MGGCARRASTVVRPQSRYTDSHGTALHTPVTVTTIYVCAGTRRTSDGIVCALSVVLTDFDPSETNKDGACPCVAIPHLRV